MYLLNTSRGLSAEVVVIVTRATAITQLPSGTTLTVCTHRLRLTRPTRHKGVKLHREQELSDTMNTLYFDL